MRRTSLILFGLCACSLVLPQCSGDGDPSDRDGAGNDSSHVIQFRHTDSGPIGDSHQGSGYYDADRGSGNYNGDSGSGTYDADNGCSGDECITECLEPGGICVQCQRNADCAACQLCGDSGYCEVAPLGTTCRPSTNVCDVSERCDGVGTTCPPDAHAKACSVCESIRSLAGTSINAAPRLQVCIDAMDEADGVLYLPAGIYGIADQIVIASSRAHGVSLRTEGKELTDTKCDLVNHDCAELRATSGLMAAGGILLLKKSGTLIDHIVVNGNKSQRAGSAAGNACAQSNTVVGFNMRWMGCNRCVLRNSVSQNALCGTGLEVSGSDDVRIERNTFAGNGVHDVSMMWADGLTVHDAANSRFVDNELVDNSDIDLIFGGCQSCLIQGNVIRHSNDFSSGAFAALMIHKWPYTSGDYTGTAASGNTIDCGPSNRCGIGLLIGSDPWYDGDVFGGSVHDNSITNVEQGVLIDDAHDMAVYNNTVNNTTQFTWTNQGVLMAAHAYSMDVGGSFNIDVKGDSTTYTPANWGAGVIPNWWDRQPAATCNPETQPWPSWGVRGGRCYKSCGNLGGTSCEAEPCSGGQIDIGDSYDCPYCCKDPFCGDSACMVGETCRNCPGDCGRCGPASLRAGASLAIGDKLNSPNGEFTLVLQEDGNLVLYQGYRRADAVATWSTRTTDGRASVLVMQSDGNLVLYAADATAVWHSVTTGPPDGKWLQLQDDGNLVIYAPPATAVWWRP